MELFLRRRHTFIVIDGAFSKKTMFKFLGDSKSRRAFKSLHWFKSYGEWSAPAACAAGLFYIQV